MLDNTNSSSIVAMKRKRSDNDDDNENSNGSSDPNVTNEYSVEMDNDKNCKNLKEKLGAFTRSLLMIWSNPECSVLKAMSDSIIGDLETRINHALIGIRNCKVKLMLFIDPSQSIPKSTILHTMLFEKSVLESVREASIIDVICR